MGHSKIYNNDSKYVIANVMDDVENVNAREYLIDFHAKSIYPAIEAMVLKEQNLDTICKDPIAIMLASKKIAEKEIARATSLEIPENITNFSIKGYFDKNRTTSYNLFICQ